jgi:mannonate dehydratase
MLLAHSKAPSPLRSAGAVHNRLPGLYIGSAAQCRPTQFCVSTNDLLMNRPNSFQQLTQGAALAGMAFGSGRAIGAEAPGTTPTPKLSPLKITKVKAILTAPAHIRLCVVKVETSEPGLYGVGCATFTQRIRTVVTAVNEYLAPFLVGKDPDNIEDIWQAMFQSSYWRNGPVLMNGLSGVDAALWDIKGKRAGMPLYQLFGGKCRTGVPVFRHASGKTMEEVADRARQFMAQGARYIRAQVGVEGQATCGAGGGAQTNAPPKLIGEGHFAGELFEPAKYRRSVPKLFKYLREQLGDEIELLHDVHERLAPIDCGSTEPAHSADTTPEVQFAGRGLGALVLTPVLALILFHRASQSSQSRTQASPT